MCSPFALSHTPAIRDLLTGPELQIIGKTNAKSRVHPHVYMDYVGVKLFTPDGKRAYIACEIANEVHVVDTAAQKSIGVIPAGVRANNLALHPSGARLFVSNGGDGTVSVIDTATNKITATIAVGKRPWGMALTPDGKKLYVANGRSDTVSVIDTEKNVKLTDIAVGSFPWGVVIQ
jgi:YVTN family beta-propeller protein